MRRAGKRLKWLHERRCAESAGWCGGGCEGSHRDQSGSFPCDAVGLSEGTVCQRRRVRRERLLATTFLCCFQSK